MAPAGNKTDQHAALAAGIVLILLGGIAVALGGSWWIIILLTIVAVLALAIIVAQARRARAGLNEQLRTLGEQLAGARAEHNQTRARHDRLLSLVQAAPEALIATDETGRIDLCNAAAATLLGLSAQRLIGRPIGELFTQEEVLRLHAEASRGAQVRREVRVSRPGGVRIWEVGASPLGPHVDASPAPVVMSVRDITELARAMQVRSDFAANASHELRTPIAAMRVAMDTLQGLDESEDPALRARFTAMIARNLERLEAMVRDLLDLSRLENPNAEIRPETFAAETLAADLRPLYDKTLRERSLSLEFDFAPEVRELHTDRNLLLLILSNLVDNATKYSFEGTPIRVIGRAAEQNGSKRGGVRFEVIDQGVGIPIDQQQRIFERYYQVDAARSVGAARRGTGLGLSIVKHAVRRLGGSIRVESVWQQGTRMIVEIPAALPKVG